MVGKNTVLPDTFARYPGHHNVGATSARRTRDAFAPKWIPLRRRWDCFEMDSLKPTRKSSNTADVSTSSHCFACKSAELDVRFNGQSTDLAGGESGNALPDPPLPRLIGLGKDDVEGEVSPNRIDHSPITLLARAEFQDTRSVPSMGNRSHWLSSSVKSSLWKSFVAEILGSLCCRLNFRCFLGLCCEMCMDKWTVSSTRFSTPDGGRISWNGTSASSLWIGFRVPSLLPRTYSKVMMRKRKEVSSFAEVLTEMGDS